MIDLVRDRKWKGQKTVVGWWLIVNSKPLIVCRIKDISPVVGDNNNNGVYWMECQTWIELWDHWEKGKWSLFCLFISLFVLKGTGVHVTNCACGLGGNILMNRQSNVLCHLHTSLPPYIQHSTNK